MRGYTCFSYLFLCINLWFNFSFKESSCLRCCEVLEDQASECARVCIQAPENPDEEAQHEHLADLRPACPFSKVDFWGCINNTYPVMNDAARWEGRICCNKAWSSSCQNSCQRAKSRADVRQTCPVKDETSFHRCLSRLEASEDCCKPSSSRCRNQCKAIFHQDMPLSAAQNLSLIQHCPVAVTQCVHNYTGSLKPQDPTDSLPCCDKATSVSCKEECRSALASKTDEQEIMDRLVQQCGYPVLMTQNEELWNCLLKTSTRDNGLGTPEKEPKGTIEIAGMDGAKLHCCHKATTSKCRQLCTQTNGRDFESSWESFESECRTSPAEKDLNLCLDDVQEPCRVGCSGLDFCSSFNDRPLEMFRNCHSWAEDLARMTLKSWQKGMVNLPNMEEIPVKDINKCHPEWWRTIACTLQIKPCHTKHAVNRICHQDCLAVLGACLDLTRLPRGKSHHTLCAALAPIEGQPPEHCIALGNYSVDGPHKEYSDEISHPCRPNPCNDTDVCQITRRKCHHQDSARCKMHTCKPACELGEVSNFHAPHASHVRVPLTSGLHCHRVCRCGNHGLLQQCKRLGCSEENSCNLGNGRIHTHNSQFTLDCNDCLCYDGEVICTKHECPGQHIHSNRGYTGLPCNCDTQYSPVCAGNGHTYWNPCLARCLGMDRFESEECTSTCDDHNCGRGSECLPRRQKCLHPANCRQHECVRVQGDCARKKRDPVCDTDGVEHVNACTMLKAGRQLAYWGHCKVGCSMTSGLVCGMDRETHASECHAWSGGVPVDYIGSCRTTPALVGREELAEYKCSGVVCPSLPQQIECKPVKPPGVCCPICASQLRVLYSEKLMASIMESDLDLTYNIHEVTQILSNQLSAAECDVFAFVSIEQDLVILVMTVTKNPTALQVLTCTREAARLSELINQRSPAIQAYALTSPLLSSTLTQPHTPTPVQSSTSGGARLTPTIAFHLLTAAFTILLTTAVQTLTVVNCVHTGFTIRVNR